MIPTSNLEEIRLRLQVAEVTISGLVGLSDEDSEKVSSAREYIQSAIDSIAMLTDDSHG